MKTVARIGVAVVAVVIGSLAWADHHESGEQGEAWFDMENCTWCKPMAENMDMMMNVQWENHVIDNGGLMTVVVPDEHKQRWEKITEHMKATEEKLTGGEEMQLCNCCKSYNKLVEAGAKVEEVKTEFGSVTLITSDKPEVADMIQQHMKRTKEEAEKMMAMKEQGQQRQQQ
jgi:hypothetical protein